MYPHEVQALMAKFVFLIFAVILLFMTKVSASPLTYQNHSPTVSFNY